MTSVPPLSREDRPDFAAVVELALRTAAVRAGLPDGAAPPGTERLRALALRAADEIAACAAAEYEAYVAARAAAGPDAVEPAGAAEPAARDGGPGVLATAAVLTPLLAGAAAAIFLLLGYALSLGDPAPALAAPLRTAGWFFAVVAGCGAVCAAAGLLVTAVRNGTATREAPVAFREVPPAAARAAAAWREALLERGVLPFVERALAAEAPGTAVAPAAGRFAPVPAPVVPPSTATAAQTATARTATARTAAPASRIPRLGYTRPEFTTPRPSRTAGPGGATDPRRGPLPGGFTGPRWSSPDYTSPERPDHP
jgi:hypothetical protein